MLSPLLHSLFTHDCRTKYDSNTIIKFADNITVGLITENDETDYMVRGGQRPGSVVSEQQPIPQHDQDKVDDCGLQEKEDQACPHYHQQGCTGTG